MIKIAICDDEKTACEDLRCKILAYMEKMKEHSEKSAFLAPQSFHRIYLHTIYFFWIYKCLNKTELH